MKSRHPAHQDSGFKSVGDFLIRSTCSAHRTGALASAQGTLAVSAARLPNLRNLGVVPDAGAKKP